MAEEKSKENSICIFPRCPECEEGYLVPFSFKEDVFEKWKCTKCSFELRKREGR